jgi:hypothetical protein
MRSDTKTATNLAHAIKRHAPAPMTDADAMAAASNITDFFKMLIEIDRENQREK